MDNSKPDKAALETALLEAQRDKVLAEIANLKKVTPFTEGIKLVSSIIVGIGGAIIAFGGFQFAQLNADKARWQEEKTRDSIVIATRKIADLGQLRDSLQQEIDKLSNDIAVKIEGSLDKAAALEAEAKPGEALQTLQSGLNTTAIDLRGPASAPASGQTIAGAEKPLATVIEDLFASKASTRGAAYSQLISPAYANNPELIPTLLDYASAHIANQNGVYNTLVVLGGLNYNTVAKNSNPIRRFAEMARKNGAKTNSQVEKVLQRLPDQ